MNGIDHSQHMSTAHHGGGGFFAEWRPDILLLTIVINILFFYLTGPGRHRFKGSEAINTKQKVFFVLASIVFYGGQGSPINYYGHAHLFSSHMLQQSLLYLIFPPLIYLAVPQWMWRTVLNRPFIGKWVRRLTHPILAILMFNALFSFYHIPVIFNTLFEIPSLHLLYHWLLLLTAFQMWFPVFCPLPEWERITDLQKMAYIFADGVLLTPACALIIFADSVMFTPYQNAPLLFEFLPPIEDQIMGGTIMKILQELIYGMALGYVFFKWARKERKKEDEDPNGMDLDNSGYASNHLPTH